MASTHVKGNPSILLMQDVCAKSSEPAHAELLENASYGRQWLASTRNFMYVQEIGTSTFKGNSWMLTQSSIKWWATLHSKARLNQLWFVILWFSNAYPLLHCHLPVTVTGKRKGKLVPPQKQETKKLDYFWIRFIYTINTLGLYLICSNSMKEHK